MLRIRDILFRIQTSDPYLWLTDPDADPGVLKTYGSYRPGSGTLVCLHHSSKIKSHKKSHKTVEIMVFLNIFSWWWKDPEPDSYFWLTDPDADTRGPKIYGSCGSGSASLLFSRGWVPASRLLPCIWRTLAERLEPWGRPPIPGKANKVQYVEKPAETETLRLASAS